VTLAVDSVRADLEALLGQSRVWADASGCANFAVDGKIPDCAVAPATAEQVAAVLNYAADHGLAVIPRGNGTKLSMGNLPRRYDVALTLRELKRVTHYEPADLTITVEPGMTFGEFQDLVGRNGLWLPLDPRGGREATIGGIIAANAAGPLRQGFGGPRDMVLGLRIATADGQITKTGGRVVKNVAGYDLGKLLTGSFGTLGVIVEASLKLFPKPPERTTFTMRPGTLGIARDLRTSILRSPLDPMRLVLLDAAAVALTADSTHVQELPEMELWIEIGGSHRVVERCDREFAKLASAVGATLGRLEEAEGAWGRVANLTPWLQQKYHDVTVLKAALPLVASEEFLSRAHQEAEAERIPLVSFTEVGLGIVQLGTLEKMMTANLEGLVVRLRQAAANLGGTLIVEHCPAQLKTRVDVWGAGGDDHAIMQKVKSAWDPKQILSPGRFLAF
jgi:glycolate oxidase FAD binding subunit